MNGWFNKIKYGLNLFKSKPQSILGLDIRAFSVNMVELEGTCETLCIQCHGREPLPSHAVHGHLIKDIDAIALSIKNVVNRAQTQCKQVVLAVPDAVIMSKIVQIHGLEEDLEELVLLEADKYVPYAIDEINLDFKVLGSQKNKSFWDVLIVASRTENITTRVETAQRAGLEVLAVDVQSYAVTRVLQRLAQNFSDSGHTNLIAILDIGRSATHLFILHHMQLTYSREEQFGEMQLVESFKENLLVQINRMLGFFYSESQEEELDFILLAGCLAQTPGLAHLIQEQLEVRTTVVNPFLGMSLSKRVSEDQIHKEAPSLLLACGLALGTIK
jgi:type IV pilus assembly protein PilM